MRAQKLFFNQPYQAEWREVDVPDPGPNEVVIRTRKTMISTGTEMTAYTGDFPPDSMWTTYISYPFPGVGYSNVGEIVALGSDVEGYQVGQRVASWGRHATVQTIGLEERSVHVVPDGVTDDQAVFWTLGKTVMNGVRLATIALGEAVVMVGVGILGQLATQYAVLSGAFPLIAVDLSEMRLEMARAHGATHTLIGGRETLLDEIREITRGRMADVAFEVTGNQHVIPGVFRMVRRRGRVILLGTPRGKTEVDFHNEVHTFGLQVIGAHVSTHPEVATPFNPWTSDRNGELFLDLVGAGKLRVGDLITHRYAWQDAAAAYQMLAEDRTQAMGVVLEDWPE